MIRQDNAAYIEAPDWHVSVPVDTFREAVHVYRTIVPVSAHTVKGA